MRLLTRIIRRFGVSVQMAKSIFSNRLCVLFPSFKIIYYSKFEQIFIIIIFIVKLHNESEGLANWQFLKLKKGRSILH